MLLLALQVKVGKVASLVGKIFVVRPQPQKHEYFAPRKLPAIYGIARRIDHDDRYIVCFH